MTQYKHTKIDSPAVPPMREEGADTSSTKSKVDLLDSVVRSQEQQLQRLHREMGRMKNSLDNVISKLNKII